MKILEALIAEIDQEAQSTKKILERVPADKFDWQPHEKSMDLKRLATHVAHLSFWPELVVKTDELDFADNNMENPKIESTKDLIDLWKKGTEASKAALKSMGESDLKKTWTLREGETVYLEAPKYNVIRQMSMNHLYHHRAQLGVYLRLLDIPIPGMYGPSADEQ